MVSHIMNGKWYEEGQVNVEEIKPNKLLPLN